jgi:DNA-binding MarR family transcriptional regulator
MTGELLQDVADTTHDEAVEPTQIGDVVTRTDGRANALQAAECLYRQRRDRSKYFDIDLFGEPSWDLLLDLFIQHGHGRAITVSSACVGACVPVSTALRWLGDLERRGLVVRTDDARDGRRTHVTLTTAAIDQMMAYLTYD